MQYDTIHIKKCTVCESDFETRDTKTKYCSQKCRNKAGNDRGNAKIAAMRRDSYVPIEQYCIECGTKYVVKRNMHGKGKYCSSPCKIKGVRKLDAVVKYNKEYQEAYRENNKEKLNKMSLEKHDNSYFHGQRKHVFERDGHKCVRCSSDHYLGVHHKDVSGKTDTPNNDLDNLITLCAGCHAREHQSLKTGIDYDMFTKEFIVDNKKKFDTWKALEQHFGVSNKFMTKKRKEYGIF